MPPRKKTRTNSKSKQPAAANVWSTVSPEESVAVDKPDLPPDDDFVPLSRARPSRPAANDDVILIEDDDEEKNRSRGSRHARRRQQRRAPLLQQQPQQPRPPLQQQQQQPHPLVKQVIALVPPHELTLHQGLGVPKQQPRPDLAPQQPRPDLAPQQPRPDLAPQQPRPDLAPQQPLPHYAPQQPRPHYAPQQPRPGMSPQPQPRQDFPPLQQQPRPLFPQPQQPVPLFPDYGSGGSRRPPSPHVLPIGVNIPRPHQVAYPSIPQQMLRPMHMPLMPSPRVMGSLPGAAMMPSMHGNRTLLPRPDIQPASPHSPGSMHPYNNVVPDMQPASPHSPGPMHPYNNVVPGIKHLPHSHSTNNTIGPVHDDDDDNDRNCVLPPGGNTPMTSFPSCGENPDRESVLPAHSAFRPNMESVGPVKSGPPLSFGKQIDQESIITRINSEVEEALKKLAVKGMFVPETAVRKLTDEIIRKARMPRGVKIPWYNIPAANDFSRLHGRTVELIKVYCLFTPIATLHDLSLAIAEVEGVADYEELGMGPIIKHPKVKDFFKPPDDLSKPPEITLFHLYKYMMKMTDGRAERRREKRYTLEDYLEFVRKKEGLETIQHLCIRVRSYPLLLQIKSKYGGMMRQREKIMAVKLEEELQSTLSHQTGLLKRKFSDHRNDDPLNIMQDMAGKDPVIILSAVFEVCMQYVGPYHSGRLNDFLQYFLKNKSMRNMFLLAIYKGAYSAEKLFPKYFEDQGGSSAGYGKGVGGASGSGHSYASHKPEGEVVELIHRYLRDLPAPVSLSSLETVERHVVDTSEVADFSSFGCGSFLAVVSGHQELLNQLGGGVGGVVGSPSGGTEARRARMMGVVHQLAPELKRKEDMVERAVMQQFGVEDFQDMGCGLPEKFLSDYSNLQTSGGLPQGNSPTYMLPLLLNTQSSTGETPNTRSSSTRKRESTQPRVGILGHKSRSDAVKCLKAAPLLEDLGVWSHWPAVFQPQLGPLPEFLQKLESESSVDSVSVLEVSPGMLLKIDRGTSIQAFNSAVAELDHVGVAGHLVSLVAVRGNARDISPQLLSGQVTSVLQEIMAGGVALAKSDIEIDEKTERVGVVSDFVLQCLLRIPLDLCKLLAREIFLDPLSKVTSTSVMEALVSLCTTRHQRWFLQELGMSVGIRKWVDDVTTMWEESSKAGKVVRGRGVEYSDDMDASMATSYSSPPTKPDLIPPVEPVLHGSNGVNGFSDPLPDTQDDEWDAETEANLPSAADPLPVQLSEQDLADLEGRCYEVVQSIRHEEFGVGVELDSEQQRVASKQREREGRGIKRLSLELYSKDTHFVLELIQNADDNSYSPALINAGGGRGKKRRGMYSVPALKFIVRRKEIIVLNNEVGFVEKNVRAICDVGRSTKSASRSGYIGQKGIGFKSVFRITNMPAIHSNGFHIRFDASSDPIGFILPHWFPQKEDESSSRENWNSWSTRIDLPLKEEQASKDMSRKFDDVQPSLLLFLHRLRSITVEDEVSERVRHMYRDDLGHGIIEIRHGDNVSMATDRWLVVKTVLEDASRYKPEVEATELALAFPLPQDPSDFKPSKDLHQQQVFAFLPLRSYGFRFIVQGDFDLPSSRECVTSDSSWNQWLREQVPGLFLQALQDMRSHFSRLDKVSEVDAIALFLQFVPLEGEVLDFFYPLTGQILNLIRGKKCLPTEPYSQQTARATTFSSLAISSSSLQMEVDESGASGAVDWKQPAQCLHVRDDFVHDHIAQELLVEALDLYYLHPSVLDCLNPSLRNQIGIKSLNVDHLKEVARVLLEKYHQRGKSVVKMELDESDDDDLMILGEEEDDDDDVQIVGVSRATGKSKDDDRDVMVHWIAGWLACVHIVVEETGSLARTDLLDKIKDLKILPLEDGNFVSANEEGTIFFPPDFKGGEGGDATADSFEDIYQEMKVLDLSLFEKGDNLTQSRLRKVLELLGVKNLYPVHIVKHHILPRFKTVKNKKILVRYLQYFKEYRGRRDSGINEGEIIPLLKKCVVLVTNSGLRSPDTEVIHFSSDYFSQRDDLVQMFPDVKWTTVSPKYLKNRSSMDERSSWLRLFEKIGVRKTLVVEKTSLKLEKDSQEWSKLQETSLKRLPNTSYYLRDYRSVEVEKIVASVSGKQVREQRHKMKLLAELLDSRWDRQHQNEMEALIYDSNNEEYLEAKTASSFSKFLVHQPWLPPIEGCEDDSPPLLVGSKLFNEDSKNVKSLLHVHVPYLDASLKSSEFRKHLQIQDSVSRTDLLGHLKSWSTASQDQDDETFITSVQHMSSVYKYLLGTNYQQVSDHEIESIKDAFTQDDVPLIFVPKVCSKDEPKNANVAGEFLSIHSVCWLDPTTVLYNYQKYNWKGITKKFPRILSLHYDDDQAFKGIFESVSVRTTPKISSLISLVKYNSSLSPHPDEDTIKNFTSIMFYLVEACQEQNLRDSYLRENLKNTNVFPSSKHVWVSPDDSCLLENDDMVIAKYFVEHDRVHFLQWPSQVSSSKKSLKNKAHQEYNKEKKQTFLNAIQIPCLSQKVESKIDLLMVSMSVGEIKERLSVYVPMIQRFLISECRMTYQLLAEQDIAAKLRELQVFTATELNILYFIDNGEEVPIKSTKSKKEASALDCSDGKPIIYISDKKKDKPPTYLYDPMLELFMSNHSDDEEKEKFVDFLTTLFRSLPLSPDELAEFAEEEELSELDESIEEWVIPLPKIAPSEPQNRPLNEEFIDEELPTLVPTAVSTTGLDNTEGETKELTCWPPKAAVDPGAYSGAAGNPQARISFNLSGSSKLKPDDVIGNDELKEVMKDYMGEGRSEEKESHVHQGRADPNSKRDSNQGRSGEERTQGKSQTPSEASAPREATSGRSHGSNISPCDSQHSSGNITGTKAGGLSSNVSPEERGTPTTKGRHSTEPSSINGDLTRGSPPWKAFVSPKNDMNTQNIVSLLDIQEYANTVGQQGKLPPVLEIVEQEWNEESLLKISRWGEEYVYSILQTRGELPSGMKIVSLNWVNREEESGKPYDIEVVVEEADDAVAVESDEMIGEEPMEVQSKPATRTVYVEVKSTATNEKKMFEISMNEIRLAQQKNDSYHVYIVYSAGLQSSRLCLLQNLHLYLRQNSGKLMLVI